MKKVSKAALRRQITGLKAELAQAKSNLAQVLANSERLGEANNKLMEENTQLGFKVAGLKKEVAMRDQQIRDLKERIVQIIAAHDGECKGLKAAIAILGGQRQDPNSHELGALFPAVIVSDVLRRMLEGDEAVHTSVRG